jgi:hypothetical protein
MGMIDIARTRPTYANLALITKKVGASAFI